MGGSCKTLRATWSHLGALLGCSWGPLRALLGLFWGVLGPSWGSFWRSGGPLRAILEATAEKRGRRQFPSPPGRLKKSILGPSWAALGALLGALGAVLGPSGAPLGPLLGHLGAILRPRMAIGSEKARKQKILIFPWFLKDVGLLGGLLGRLRGHLEPSWGDLGASWSIVGAILRHLGVSWAILEPS